MLYNLVTKDMQLTCNKTLDVVTYLPPFGNIKCSAIAQFAPFCLTRIKEHNEEVKIAIQLHYV